MRHAEATMRSLALFLEMTQQERDAVMASYQRRMMAAECSFSDYEESALTFAHAVERVIEEE